MSCNATETRARRRGPRPGEGRTGLGETLSPEEIARQGLALLEYAHPRAVPGAELFSALDCKSCLWPDARAIIARDPRVVVVPGAVGQGLRAYRWRGGRR